MTLHFNLEYKTVFGEQIVLNIQREKAIQKLPMTTLNGEKWSLDWSVEQPDTEYTNYYSVERAGIVCKTE